MTLVATWTRTTRTGRELWVMSDSRLSGGKFWDYGPKIFGIGRSDAVIAFAGDTSWTYLTGDPTPIAPDQIQLHVQPT